MRRSPYLSAMMNPIDIGRRLLVQLSVVLLVTAAAVLAQAVNTAGAAEFAMSVRSIDEVADGPMPQIVVAGPTEAVLEFQSSIPLACSVVFGETPDFGFIATDSDMAGGAHTDHHPVLAGLKADTEYFYRVQGAGADGTLFVGEVQTFRTPPESENVAINLASLAAGARVGAVSSNFGGAQDNEPWGAEGAVDQTRTTAWSSWGDGDDAFIEIILAEEAFVHEVSLWTRTMTDGTAQILSFTVTTDQGTVFGPFTLPDGDSPYWFPIDDVASSLRIDVVESTGGNVGLIEFGAFGP